MDVADWLRALGLERYEAAFRENDVSAEELCHLTAEDLKELGVTAVGHRRRLLVAIAKLTSNGPRRCSSVDDRRVRTVDDDAASHLRANAASSP